MVLLTPDEAAAFLRVSKVTVYRLVSSGRLPHLYVANCLRFVQADLEAWVRRQRRER